MKHNRQEGAALFVVLMIIMVGSASGVFAANTAAMEIRGTGFARQQIQTRNAARSGLYAALDWFDIFGPETVRDILQNPATSGQGVEFDCTAASNCYPEVSLHGGRRAYRLAPEHFEALLSPDGGTTPGLFDNVPTDQEAAVGLTSSMSPLVVIDIYDEHVISKLAPGAAAQGGTKFKYMQTTLTARGRTQVGSDVKESEDSDREFNESGADMRAYIVSGPFITGS